MHTNRAIILAGGLILMIASRLPWMQALVLFGVEGPEGRGKSRQRMANGGQESAGGSLNE